MRRSRLPDRAGVRGQTSVEESVVLFSEGQRIYADIQAPARPGGPVVLMSHGFESSKDGAKWRVLAPRLAGEGYGTMRFSYRGCGEGPHKSEGLFEDITLSSHIKDYRAAIDYLEKRPGGPGALGVIGSSFGGTVALAARDKRVRAMVALSTPCHFPAPRRSGALVEAAQRSGYINLASGKRLKLSFYADLQRYDVCRDAADVGCPLLIVHSSSDEVVPLDNAHRIYGNAVEPRRLEIVDGATHSFDAEVHLEQAIALVLEWFEKYLKA